MKVEDLELILKNAPEVKNLVRKPIGDELFERCFEFEVRGQQYKIIWYTNYSHLYINDVEVIFYNMELNTTYPTHYKNFLAFTHNDDYIIAVIPLEKYGENNG